MLAAVLYCAGACLFGTAMLQEDVDDVKVDLVPAVLLSLGWLLFVLAALTQSGGKRAV
jgi:hypothetical protein